MLSESIKCLRLQNIPRFSSALFAASNSNHKNVLVNRNLFTCKNLYRDRTVVYNSKTLVVPTLAHNRIRKKEKRAIPIISPSEQFSSSLGSALESVYQEDLEYFPVYYPAGIKLERFLKARTLPVEGVHLRRKEELIDNILKEEYDLDEQDLTDETFLDTEKRKDDYYKRKRSLQKIHLDKWVPVDYDKTCSFAYLLARSSAEYAVLETIFTELKYQEPDFQLNSFFDYGSGVGTGYWAANQVFGNIAEMFCVDSSTNMNDLAKNIILKGAENKPLPLGVSFRLHTPSTTSLKYNLVLSAYSLMEKKSGAQRLETINNLWSRVEENGCLVVVELGTNAGFQIISEIRDYITQISEGEDDMDIVAPCPHKHSCPRYLNDTIPCNFMVKYRMFDLNFFKKSHIHKELYSYIVIKKGRRSRTNLPRLVEEPVRTKTHFFCRLCTQKGTLQEVRCDKRLENELYQFCKTMHWGDEFPVQLAYPNPEESVMLDLEDGKEEDKQS